MRLLFGSFVFQRASNAERIADKLREQVEKMQATISSDLAVKSSEELHAYEDNERVIREKLELELAAKEREIATLVVDTQKLQSTLIKVKETSVSQVEIIFIIMTTTKNMRTVRISL
jgi:DNA mismatch repair ATPase MutS